MKKFFKKIFFFSIFFISIILLGIILPKTPRASKSLLFSKIKKDSLLREVNERRLILIGGSNLSFGINSQLIKDSLGVFPINTSIHAGLGLSYMMSSYLPYSKKKDIVILAPEYHQFYGDLAFGSNELLRVIFDVKKQDIKYLNINQMKNIFKYIFKYSLSKFKPNEYFSSREDKIYGVNSFNKYGDAYKHWYMDNKDVFPSEIKSNNFNYSILEEISQFKEKLEKKGVKFYLSYPGYQESSFNLNIEKVNNIQKIFEEKDFNLLGTPYRYRINDSLIFNTPYHLSKTGVDIRTQLLISDLKEALLN